MTRVVVRAGTVIERYSLVTVTIIVRVAQRPSSQVIGDQKLYNTLNSSCTM